MTEAPKTDLDSELPGMGHNAVDGLPTLEKLTDDLVKDNQPALDRTAALLAKGQEFLTIENDAQDSDATEFLVKLRARYKASEADRVAAKSPFDDLAGAVQAFFKTRILDPLGRGPDNKTEEFDPVTSDFYGLGPRITMAQTLFKRRKAEAERKEREAKAEAARKAEADAKAKRDAEAAEAKRKADAEAAAAKAKADAEAAARKAAADKAAADAQAAADAAARKRNADNKAAADKAAAEAAARAAQIKAEQEAADRKAAAELAERNRIAAQQQAERDRLALEEANRLAEERAKLEDAANATTADLSRARGGKGGVSSLKEFLDWRDVDRTKLGELLSGEGFPVANPGHVYEPSIVKLLPYITDAALEKAIKYYAAANKGAVTKAARTGKEQPIHGVVFFMNSRSAGRS